LYYLDIENKFDLNLFQSLLKGISIDEYSPKTVLILSHLERIITASYYSNLLNSGREYSNYAEIVKFESKNDEILDELMVECVKFYNKGFNS
jgi:hypothetical protein